MLKWIKRIALIGTALTILVVGAAAALWYSLDLAIEPRADPASTSADLGFASVQQGSRGRILAVVSSADQLADGSKGGYELTELARAYWVFVHNGYAVDIASPQGGEPPMILDDGLVEADYAFVNDAQAQQRLKNSLALSDVDPSLYEAVYFVGGKGSMIDFPGNPEIARIVRDVAPRGVVGAVCHGPAALLGIDIGNGQQLLSGRKLTSFSNAEEHFLSAAPVQRLGFLLEDALTDQASFSEGPMYLDHVVVDDRLVTGQNPWSAWSTAESVITALGHTPADRPRTAEEYSVDLLVIYRADSLAAAFQAKQAMPRTDKRLLAMHAVIAAMQWNLWDAWSLHRLARA